MGRAVLPGAELVGIGIAGGAVMGLVWLWVTPAIWYEVRSNGAFPEPSASGRWFSADGWFLVLGIGLGLALGIAAWFLARRHPVGALLGLTIGGLLGAVTAWLIGGAFGPPNPLDVVSSLAVGDRLQDALGLRAWAVILAPALAGVLTFTVLAAAVSPRDAGETLVS
ncbi:MAG TPA: hypothetical protein VMT88_05110 [Actinomycetes bacterium]|nr:hypothetical protein [Actinomycetes bacterium]